MRTLALNSDLAQALRRKGIERAARFSWQLTAERTASLYRRVAGGTSPEPS
jgi:glycosyltransferase involved in cell wall biosynthesis